MSLKTVLQDADPIRHEPSAPDVDRVRMRVVNAAREADTAPRTRSRRSMLIAAAAFIAIAIVGLQLWTRDAIVQAAVRFEVRLAEDQPGPGLTAARVGTKRTIYLHPDAVVTNADIASSNVQPAQTPGQFWISVRFNAQGTQKMREATAGHLGRPVAILLDGDVVMAPTLKSAIGDSAMITGDYTRAQAERIANGMSLGR